MQSMVRAWGQPLAQSGTAFGATGGTAATEQASPAVRGSADVSIAETGAAATTTAQTTTAATRTAATATAATTIAATGSAVTATAATASAVTATSLTGTALTRNAGTETAGTETAGTGTAGTAAAGTAGSAATPTGATGTASIGTAAAGTASTGPASIGTASTVPTATAAAATAATVAASTGTAVSVTAPTGAAAGGAAVAAWATRPHGGAIEESAGAETPSTGLVAAASSGPVASAPVSGTSASTSASPLPTSPAVPVPLASQVARPLFTLAAAGPGEHTMSISITPDDLGPVVVRAQISATGIRLELFAPTDVARDALRLILPDLRRDLAGGALPASLDLSTRSQPGDAGSSGRQDRPAADQQGAQLGGDPRGAQDRRREPGATDQWLRSASAGADTSATDAVTDLARPDRARGRVDVLA